MDNLCVDKGDGDMAVGDNSGQGFAETGNCVDDRDIGRSVGHSSLKVTFPHDADAPLYRKPPVKTYVGKRPNVRKVRFAPV